MEGFTLNKARMMDILIELCKIPSISETKGEIDMAYKIHEILMRNEYFKNNPENAIVHDIKNDIKNRKFVSAFFKGNTENKKTVILLSHFDVVAVSEYGAMKEYAFDPVLYTEILKTKKPFSLPKDVQSDLDSNNYLFGRGTMDMKYGIAADIEVLNQVSYLENFDGNILFLSVPDEEANSAGMLGSLEFLHDLREKNNLIYSCAIISEPYFIKHTQDKCKYIYTGTVGKLLPMFFCVGKETHVCEPYAGLNPNLMCAAILDEIEQNPNLSDHVEDTFVPPPMCLKLSDNKDEYSVQIPTSAYLYFNIMTLYSTPSEIMDKMKLLAKNAFTKVINRLQDKAKEYAIITKSQIEVPKIDPKVLSFEEFIDECKKNTPEVETYIQNIINKSDSIDLRELTLEVLREAHKYYKDRNPIIVVCYAPPYYPHAKPSEEGSKVFEVCNHIIKYAKDNFNEDLAIEPYFPGLSDMSYLRLSNDIDIKGLTKNFPVWGELYSVPLDIIATLNIPFINLGPLGKDAHKYTERINISYSFDIASKLLFESIFKFLQ